MRLQWNDGTTLTGIIYLMNQGIATEPNSYYYSTIVHGYQDFGFDLAFLEDARQKIYLEASAFREHRFKKFV